MSYDSLEIDPHKNNLINYKEVITNQWGREIIE